MDQKETFEEVFGLPTPRGLGDNAPPDEIALLRERLQSTSAILLVRRDELLAAVERVPASIETEELCGKVSDFVRQIAAYRKTAEGSRIAAKEPHLAAARAVDGFFKAIIDPLDEAKAVVVERITKFQRRKAEAERQRREEEARRQREAAEAARRTAEEADRQALAREAAARKRKAGEDAEDAARRAAEEAARRAAEEAIAADDAARQAEADAAQAAKVADAKPAELSRTRGDYGAVASLRTFWDFRDLDRATIDLEALRPHLPLDALEKAVRSYIRAGGRGLRGVVIFENTATAVR